MQKATASQQQDLTVNKNVQILNISISPHSDLTSPSSSPSKPGVNDTEDLTSTRNLTMDDTDNTGNAASNQENEEEREITPNSTSSHVSHPHFQFPEPSFRSNNQVEDDGVGSQLRPHQRRSLPPMPSSRMVQEEDLRDMLNSARSVDGYNHKYISQLMEGDSEDYSEQRALHEELIAAIWANNVKAAVAALRKMYTRQSRNFRIPALLSQIMPDTTSMLKDNRLDIFHATIKFSLECIQWCFGNQRGENVESFKYKMNKNISRWLLKETQRKGLPNPATQYTINIAVSLVKAILIDTTELEFALEILTSLNVPKPLQYFIPFVSSWLKSPPAFQAQLDMKVLRKFIFEHPDLHAFLQGASPPVMMSTGGKFPFRSLEEGSPTSVYSVNNPPDGRDEGARHGHMQQDTRQHILNYYTDFGAHQGREIDQVVLGSNSQSLESKLLKLLTRSAKGELGARIPALYRDEYGEPLRLKGRKLKDILLETGMVEMVGSDGPGDKLFRIIGKSKVGDGPLDVSEELTRNDMSPRPNDHSVRMNSDGRYVMQHPVHNNEVRRKSYGAPSSTDGFNGLLNSQEGSNAFNIECSGLSSGQDYGFQDMYSSRHQLQHHTSDLRNEVPNDLMYGNPSDRDSPANRNCGDVGSYVNRLFAGNNLSPNQDRGHMSPEVMLDAFDSMTGGGKSTLSELNMNSFVLGQAQTQCQATHGAFGGSVGNGKGSVSRRASK